MGAALSRGDHEVRATATRFAPSPTGELHLGHAYYSALFAEAQARDTDGRFLVRIEDIDRGRCRPEFETGILEDLSWLGLRWEEPVRRQSDHMDDYAEALSRLESLGVLYPCFCTRKDIAAEIAAAGQAPHGPDGPHYPGTCRRLSAGEWHDRIGRSEAYARRLDMDKAMALAGPLDWSDRDRGTMSADPTRFGDVVLARKDVPTSYHLAVTLDDHLQGITLVTRGEDLFEATHVHRLLQALLGLDVPEYRHHRLLRGADGKRFAKRDCSLTVKALRESGRSAEEVCRRALEG